VRAAGRNAPLTVRQPWLRLYETNAAASGGRCEAVGVWSSSRQVLVRVVVTSCGRSVIGAGRGAPGVACARRTAARGASVTDTASGRPDDARCTPPLHARRPQLFTGVTFSQKVGVPLPLPSPHPFPALPSNFHARPHKCRIQYKSSKTYTEQ